MDLSYVIHSGDYILLGVFALLVLMSIASWCVLIVRVVRLYAAKRANRRFMQTLQDSGSLKDCLHSTQDSAAPAAQLAREGYAALQKYRENPQSPLHGVLSADDYLARHLHTAFGKAVRPFQRGLIVLASSGATAPFIGLFGTVWGIYHALINIGQSGQMTLAAVSQPIGEALVATAAGLFVAIPAVLAYNALVHANKNLAHELQNFTHELHLRLLDNGEK